MVYLVVLVAVVVMALQLAGREHLGKVLLAVLASAMLLVEAVALALLAETESVELVEQAVQAFHQVFLVRQLSTAVVVEVAGGQGQAVILLGLAALAVAAQAHKMRLEMPLR
jgi:hypothetical protein